MEDNTKYVINKSFNRLLLPTTAGSISVVVTILAGVALVSHYFGANGLAIASLFIPLVTLWGCLYEALGIAASTMLSLSIGDGNRHEGHEVVAQSNLLTLLITVVISSLGIVATWLVSAETLGIEAHLFDDAVWYARIMFLTTIPLVMNNYLTFVLRADSAQQIAFASSVVQVVANIALSILFMGTLGLGIKGAALAVLVASLLACTITVFYLLTKIRLGLKWALPTKHTLKEVWEYAVDPIADNVSEVIIAAFMHVFVLVVFGVEVASVVYIIHYIKMFVLYFSIGVTNSSSPILGVYFGEQNNRSLNYMAAKGIRYALVIGGVMALLIGLFAHFISAGIFSFEFEELYGMCNGAIRIYALSVVFFLINILITNYCRQTKRFHMSLVITVARVLVLPFLFISVALLIESTVLLWWSFLVVEVITLLVWLLYMYRLRRKLGADSILCLPQNKNLYKGEIYFLLRPDESHTLADYQEMAELFLTHHEVDASKIMRTQLVLEELMNYAHETHHRKKGYVSIQLAVTPDRDVRLMVKLDNDTIDVMAISSSYTLESGDLLSLHLLRSLTTEFTHHRVLSFNTMSMLITDTKEDHVAV